jgi:hypothetical protein
VYGEKVGQVIPLDNQLGGTLGSEHCDYLR